MKFFKTLVVITTKFTISATAGLLFSCISMPGAQAATQPHSWYQNQIDRVIYVAPEGTGNGSSYSTPMGSLRSAVTTAINASNEATPKDVMIYLKNGTYAITGSGDFSGANLSTVLMFEGESEGGVILDGSSWTSDEPALTVHAYKRNVTMRNLIFRNFRKAATVFRGGYSGAAANQIADHDNWRVENCEWKNNGTALVQDSRDNNRSPAALFTHMQNFTLRNCKFLDNGGPGLDFMGRNALLEDLTVSGNYTRSSGTNTANGGMNFAGLNIIIKRCKFNRNGRTGLRMDHVAEQVTITDCEFNNNGYNGMFWEVAYGPVTVRNCAINNNGGVGIGLASSYDFNIEQCNIQNNVEKQIEILAKNRQISGPCTGDPHLCAGAAGDFNLPVGSNWGNMKAVEYVKRTKLSNSIVSTTVNTNPLIAKNLGNGSGGEYQKWVRSEFNANYNTYYSTQTTNMFDISSHYNQYYSVNLASWKTEQNVDSAQGDDENSVWANPSVAGTGLKAQYYNNTTTPPTLVSTRTDATVNFDWAYSSPMIGIGADNFSVRWTGQIQAVETGTYTFTTSTDDGAKLWVNETLLINRWTNQSALPAWSGSIYLVAGQKYDITLDYYEATGRASARLYWTRPGGTSVIIPQSQLYPAL